MAVREFLLGEDGYRAAVDAAAGIKAIQPLIVFVIDLTRQVNGGTGPPEGRAAVVNFYPAPPGSDAATLQHMFRIGVGSHTPCHPVKPGAAGRLMEVAADVIPPPDNILRDVVFGIRQVIVGVAKWAVCIQTTVFIYQGVPDIFRAGSPPEAEVIKVIHRAGKL